MGTRFQEVWIWREKREVDVADLFLEEADVEVEVRPQARVAWPSISSGTTPWAGAPRPPPGAGPSRTPWTGSPPPSRRLIGS